ncbi:hypothetical protein D2Q93_02015 [Alicyclobacillaceae bacterium I2511]|nr:hypothetical protein D2Q93_02015 [Alicyclobacillaceae bacterium I2511]
MTIDFIRMKKHTHFLDPRKNFQETVIESEIRVDPLTQSTGRIAHFSKLDFPAIDVEELSKQSLAGGFCPFCPNNVESVTPKFPSDITKQGRFRQGEAVVFPNLSPYDAHSAVTVVSRNHLVPMQDLTATRLTDALEASIQYFRAVHQRDKHLGYGLINWNYFPMAGASLLHPHLQVFATDTPGNYLKLEIEGSRAYRQQTGRSFWEDFLAEEKRLNERYLGDTGSVSWVVNFIPFGFIFDVTAVFRERLTVLDLTHDDVFSFAQGMQPVLRYMQDHHIYSFNLALYPSATPEDDVWVHARISARGSFNPAVHAADVGAIRHMYNEPFAMFYPEQVAEEMRPLFF